MKRVLAFFVLCFVLTGTAQTVVYTEDFQSGIPVNYTLIDNDGLTVDPMVSEFSDAWISLEDPDNAGDFVVGSTSFFAPVGVADRWLITPQISLGAYGNILYWNARSHDASFPDSYQVLISTTGTDIASFDTLKTIYSELATWNARTLNLSDSGYNNVSVYLAFRNMTNDGFKLYLDDISIEIEDPAGVQELTESNVKIFPNPVAEILTVEINDFQMATLYNGQGTVVRSLTQSKINVSDLAPGVYFIEVQAAGAQISRRFIKL